MTSVNTNDSTSNDDEVGEDIAPRPGDGPTTPDFTRMLGVLPLAITPGETGNQMPKPGLEGPRGER